MGPDMGVRHLHQRVLTWILETPSSFPDQVSHLHNCQVAEMATQMATDDGEPQIDKGIMIWTETQ